MFNLRSRLRDWGKRDGDGLRAIDELANILSGDGELSHRALEVAHHQLLVIDHALPFAGRALSRSWLHVRLCA